MKRRVVQGLRGDELTNQLPYPLLMIQGRDGGGEGCILTNGRYVQSNSIETLAPVLGGQKTTHLRL